METTIEYFKDCISQAKKVVGKDAVVKINAWPKALITILDHEAGGVVGCGCTFEDALRQARQTMVRLEHRLDSGRD